MFNPGHFENARTGGVGVLEVVEPNRTEALSRTFVPLKRSELRGTIAGPLAALSLRHTFGYSRQQLDRVLEAIYRFPLPGDAAVTHVRVTFGDVEIVAKLQERTQAEQAYADAKQQGQQAALLTREAPNVFTLQVTGLQPDQEITVETCYVQLAQVQGLTWTLRIPLTTAPRYVREDERGSRPSAGQPLALLRDPGHRFGLDLTLHNVDEVSSPTHTLDVVRTDENARVRLRARAVVPDRDCVLVWQPVQQNERPTLRLFIHREANGGGYCYFLAQITPPAHHTPGSGVPREVTLLVDHSGSMEGAKWAATDWTVERFLRALHGHDALALGLFHTTTLWFEAELTPADEETVARAIAFAHANRDSGGTNLGIALEQALAMKPRPGERSRHLLIVTDAQVTDEGRILRLADGEAMRGELRRRINVLCIDAAPNAFLAQELAARGGGVAHFLTSAPDADDITTALDEVMADWSEPVLTGLQLAVDHPGVEAADRTVEVVEGCSLVDLGDLPAGRCVWVAGRVALAGENPLTFRLQTRDGVVLAQQTTEQNQTLSLPALKALFGVRRINGLEHLMTADYEPEQLVDQLQRLGYTPDDVLGDVLTGQVYAENRRAQTTKALKALLVQEALRYGLASSETGFVAVRAEAGTPVSDTVAVANALPAGWSDNFMPRSMAAPRAARAVGGARGMMRAAMSSLPGDANLLAGLSMVAPSPALNVMPPMGVIPGGSGVSSHSRGTFTVLFSGIPTFDTDHAVLFDSQKGDNPLPATATITGLRVRFPAGPPATTVMGQDVALLIYVDDLAEPRARVRPADLLRAEIRPLNLLRQSGATVRIVLRDPQGAMRRAGVRVEVALTW